MYEEARVKIINTLRTYDRHAGEGATTSNANYWVEQREMLADQIISILLTPSQLKEWKAGGKLGVICRDQSLPVVFGGDDITLKGKALFTEELGKTMQESDFRRVIQDLVEEAQSEKNNSKADS